MLLGVFVCLSVRRQDFLQSNERICMKFSPELCLWPGNNSFHFGDDTDYVPDHMHKHFAKKDSVVSVYPCCVAEVCSL